MLPWRDILIPSSNHTFGKEEDDSLGTGLFKAAYDVTRTPAPPLEGTHDHKKLLEEMDLDVIKDASGQAFPYQFAKGYPLGLSFAQRDYEVTDPYIKDAPLRNEVSKLLLKADPQKQLKWKEKAGVLHLGGQAYTFVPLAVLPGGASIGPGFGFAADALLRYRTLYPCCSESQETLPLPLTAKIAASMPQGAEFEFIGHIGGGVSAGVSITEGYAVGPAMVGAAFYTNSGIGGTIELGICVTALDKKDQVRITVRRLNKIDSNFAIGVTAGLMYQIASNWTSTLTPNATLLPQSKATSNYLGTFTGLTTATASASAGESEAFATIFSVDLDASTGEGQEIYKQILLLHFDKALNLAKQNEALAKVAFAKEHSSTHNRDASTTMMTETLLQDTENDQLATGSVKVPSGNIHYVDAMVSNSQTFWLWGARDVKWQEVGVQKDGVPNKNPYFRFRYSDTDLRFSLKRLFSFIRFAKLFGIEQETIIGGGEQRLAALKDRLQKAAKVEIKYDLFFSTCAIETILQASSEKVKDAYIEASRLTKAEYADTPLLKDDENSKKAQAWLNRFEQRAAKHRYDIFGMTPKMHECYVEYTKLTGRSLSMDYGLLKQAEEFAQLVESAKCKECLSDGAQLLFVELGKQKGFDFKQSIGALVKLVPREEVRVHELSLKSGAIKLEATVEKELKHPHDSVTEHLVSLG